MYGLTWILRALRGRGWWNDEVMKWQKDGEKGGEKVVRHVMEKVIRR